MKFRSAISFDLLDIIVNLLSYLDFHSEHPAVAIMAGNRGR
ncbi:MAG: hypothetical protein ACQESU_06980 [Halobacteriota archaeon]